MGDVVTLPLTESGNERGRFEAWIGQALGTDEARALLTRDVGGDYVLGSTRAAWAAWRARGFADARDRNTGA